MSAAIKRASINKFRTILLQPIGFVERKLKQAQGGLSPAANRRASNTVKLESATIEAMSTACAANPAINNEPRTTST
jgi:hypothetical protein